MSEIKYGIIQGAVVSAPEDVLDLLRRINGAGNECRAFDVEDLIVAPLNEGRAISELGTIVNMAKHVSVRDEDSLRILRSWGLARPIDIYGDESELDPEPDPKTDQGTITTADIKGAMVGAGQSKVKAESKKGGKKSGGKKGKK